MKKNILLFVAVALGLVLIVLGVNKLIFSTNNVSESKNQKIITEVMEISETIKLPDPVYTGRMSVEESLKERRSMRNFTDKQLSLQEVSQVLWAAYGVSDAESFAHIKLKTAPSAGATYPLEIYLMAGNVERLTAGLYKYHPEKNELSLYLKGDIRSQVAKACLDQRMLADAPATIIYNVVFERTTQRYGQRGLERYVYMDIGHSAQNIYLQTTAMGMATCAIGAFEDDKLTKVISPPENEVVMYLMPFGYTK